MRSGPWVAAAVAVSCAATAAGQVGGGGGVPPSYGHDFVTIGAVGNAAYAGPTPWGAQVLGRGRVDYEYRIGRGEVTTGQWMEFLNVFSQTATPPRLWSDTPNHWGAGRDVAYAGPGYRIRLREVADAERLPVGGITFNMAAQYCNWLHNGQSTDPASLEYGAYDLRAVPAAPLANQNLYATHLPGARYWIPTLDEWLKAAQYDPDRHGPGQGGWWQYRNTSDQPGVPGPPGVGTTSAGWNSGLPNFAEWDVPLGAYPGSRSPWGLLDTSGGAAEWTQDIAPQGPWPAPWERQAFGPATGPTGDLSVTEWAGFWTSYLAVSGFPEVGLRVASAVPTPGTAVVAIFGVMALGRRTRVPAARRA